MTKRALVTYASKRGGTAGLAEAIAETLRARGLTVDCMPVERVEDVSGYDAVVIGSGLYMNRWLRAARRFVATHADALRTRPVWLFSSGPLDGSATEHPIPPTRSVANAMALVRARGHVTFGGRLAPDAKGLIAAAMAKKLAGDWRDWLHVRRWAGEVATAIALSAEHAQTVRAAPTVAHPLLALLCLVAGIPALLGGLAFIIQPDGSLLRMPLAYLAHSPFETFMVPGLILMIAVGGACTTAGVLLLRRSQHGPIAAFMAGLVLLGWITIQMLLLRTAAWQQLTYVAVALATIAFALASRVAHPLLNRRI